MVKEQCEFSLDLICRLNYVIGSHSLKNALSFSGHGRHDVFVSGKNLIASVEAKPSSIYELYVQ